ncbi:MAG: ABC transporter permease [Anaerolineales bacterium]|nr:MAG: ABC transporter permease [Anaerolineales bacterium]
MSTQAGADLRLGMTTRPVRPRRTLWGDVWHRLRRNGPAMAGLTIIILMYLTAILAPLIAPYEYDKIDLEQVRAGPSPQHLMGTDELGRDVFSRIVWAARSAAFVSITVTGFGLALGIFFGVLSGYLGGRVDMLIMRLGDVLFAFPGLLFVFFIAATIRPGLIAWVKAIGLRDLARSGYVDYLVVIIALSLVGWPGLARLIRGQLLSLKKRDYVLAAQAIGVPTWRIMLRHLLPNAMPPVIVAVSGGIGGIILSEATLSFLGIGLQPPNPSWGAMLYQYYGYWRTELWPLLFIPAAVLVAIVLAFNFVGDGLNEALNPQLD